MSIGVERRGTDRVIRGGSWNNNARNVRAATRNWNHPGNRDNNLGFRLARVHGGAGWLLLDQFHIATDRAEARPAKTDRAPACQ